MRVLKTKYPCKWCGEPAEVASRREAEHATCERCRERNRLVSRGNYFTKDVGALQKKVPSDGPEIQRLAAWLEIAAKELSAAHAYSQAVGFARPADKRKLIRAAGARLEWSHSVVRQLGELARRALAEEQHGLEVIAGAASPEVAEAVVRPVLRLVRSE